MTVKKYKAGIDYSITSPALCICKGEEFKFENCVFHYFSDDVRFDVPALEYIVHHTLKEYDYEVQRFHHLAKTIVGICANYKDCEGFDILLEEYAFAAKGQVFNIGENGGILKLVLITNGMKFRTRAPTTIKKFATGSGRAKKEDMYASFKEETNQDLVSYFGVKHEGIGPIGDIVDAYYMCKYNWENPNG